jgi:transcriptional regulator with XRE-family HTH domain
MNQPGSNIRTLRQHLNLSMKQLSKASGVDAGTLSRLETGVGGYSRESIHKIADALGVTPGVLFADGATVEAASFGARRVPVLSAEQLADWKGGELPMPDEDQEYLFEHLRTVSQHAFALRVQDEANLPTFKIGDHIVFDPAVTPGPGSMVVAVDGQKRVHFGRLRILDTVGVGEHVFEIVPTNEFYPSVKSATTPGLVLRGTLATHKRYLA